jgi:hypothetical protein
MRMVSPMTVGVSVVRQPTVLSGHVSVEEQPKLHMDHGNNRKCDSTGSIDTTRSTSFQSGSSNRISRNSASAASPVTYKSSVSWSSTELVCA